MKGCAGRAQLGTSVLGIGAVPPRSSPAAELGEFWQLLKHRVARGTSACHGSVEDTGFWERNLAEITHSQSGLGWKAP